MITVITKQITVIKEDKSMKTRLIMVLFLALVLALAQSAPLWASELEIVEQDKAPVAESQMTGTATAPASEVIKAQTEALLSNQAQAPAQTSEPVAPSAGAKIVRAVDETMPTAAQRGKKVMPLPPGYAEKPTVDAPTKYTLGPDDVIEIIVRRHPEFSATYPINAEGKIQYKFVGDIELKGLTKTEVKDRITQILSKYIITPDVDVTIMDYRSKVIYVIGEVGAPGKYYMKADEISLREAVVQAGLPTLSAAMRRTTLVRPDKSGKPVQKALDLYALLYEGKLNLDLVMIPGDVVYVPATLFAKIMRIINPVAGTVSSTKEVAAYGY
jgi:protein involved in polysaccharide export with SLBB domain